MRRLIWLPLGGFLLIAGAAIAAAAVPTITPAAPQALQDASPAPNADATPAPNTDGQSDIKSDQPPFSRLWAGGQDLINQVLSDLVANNTISQNQADAITKALQDAVDQKQAQLDQQRQALQDQWSQIQGFLEDGVITQDEVDQLPADSPFRQMFDSIAQNGQVTQDQLRQLGPGGFFGPGHGHGGGPGMGHPWFDQDSDNSNSGSRTNS